MNTTRKVTRLERLRTKLSNNAAIVLQLLVFIMFSVLAANSWIQTSGLKRRQLALRNSLSRLDDRTNDVDYYHRIEYDALVQQTQDIRHTLHNKTSLVFPSLIESALPSVVGITNSNNSINSVNGTGFVIDAANGYIMTAKHVVSRDLLHAEYEIELMGGERISVKRIYKYPEDDLAILVVDISDPNYCIESELQIADAINSNTIRRGDIVITLGHPFSILFSASAGIISNPKSAHYRDWPNDEFAERVQYDAACSPGNSGCAVIGVNGKVIGVYVTGKWVVRQNSGVSFAVPAKTINECIGRFNEWLTSENISVSN